MKVKCIVDNFDYIKYGETYTFIEDKGNLYKVFCDDGLSRWYRKDSFEIVKEDVNSMTFEEKIALAESMVGKEVMHVKGAPRFVVNEWRFNKTTENVSAAVKQNVIANKFCISVDGSFHYPVEDVKLVPEYVEIKLNDTPTAQIFKDRMEIGGQTFTKEKLKEIFAAMETFK